MAPTQRAYDALDARKTALLRPFYAKLAVRDTTPVDWVAFGDSTTEGARQTSPQTRWVGRALKQLRQRMVQAPVGGFGYVPCWYSTGDMQDTSPSAFWRSGAPTSASLSSATRGNYGLARRSLAMSGSTSDKSVLTLTSGTVYASTAVDLFYARANTPTSGLDVYLDDIQLTSIVTQITAGQEFAGAKYRISGLAAGDHVIEARATGQVAYFEGWMLYNGDETAGIRLWEAGASGSTTLWHAQASVAGKGSPTFVYSYDNLTAIQPCLVTVMLGINDYWQSTQQQTPAEYATNLTQIIANIRGACTVDPAIVLMTQWERGNVGTTPPHAWSEYTAALYGVVAADNGVLLFDGGKRFPTGPATTAYNLMFGDLIHINDTGGGYLADQFVNWIMPR